MKAFAYDNAHALDAFELTLRDVDEPVAGPNDLLVAVKAFSLNPVDCKVRLSRSSNGSEPVILGWDAAGVVEAVGAAVSGFAVGDEVYYAGDLNRAGSYAQRQAVDYRLVAHKPASLDFAGAAALPLTSLTAWEAMLERGVQFDENSNVLIVGGGGGVGSVAIQLLKATTSATVIATAGRPETIAWVKLMGADHVVGRDLAAELTRIGVPLLDVLFSTTHTANYLPVIPDLLHPFGHLMVIDDPAVLDIRPFKPKALSVHWEFMFAKAAHGYRPETQGAILGQVAALVDEGKIRSTRNRTIIADVDELRAAHVDLEAGVCVGKTVVHW